MPPDPRARIDSEPLPASDARRSTPCRCWATAAWCRTPPSSFCSLAGRRRVDPVEAAQLTGHSLNVWTRHYARSFGKAQRDEARARMLEHGSGDVDDAENAVR
jgi:hypothetical protein